MAHTTSRTLEWRVACKRSTAMRISAVLVVSIGCAPAATPAVTSSADALVAVDALVDSAAVTADARSLDASITTPLHALAGINFPPTQGTSNAGAFMAGVYTWSYTNAQIAAANATFQAMRLPINVATANDPAALAQLKGYVDQFAGGEAIICMFGTTHTSASHGDGLPDGLQAMGEAWAKIDAVFGSYPNVHYEIFNEPFGYQKTDPAHYVADMKSIIQTGGLPEAKCILDGMGYADNIQLVAQGGWTGDLAYHFYPTWSPDHTQPTYSNLVQGAIGNLGRRTWVTEFGANLEWSTNTCYQTFDDGTHTWSGDINALRGLDDALGALRAHGNGVKGAFYWHGWNNGDGYDFWLAASAQGACKVKLLQSRD